MPARRSVQKGLFFVFEGGDGVGKTTQIQLLSDHIRARRGLRVLIVREPGGTSLGEKVRRILLQPSTGRLDPATELFLFMAARSHLTLQKIKPALREGSIVICDRYLWSSVVYQGMVGGLGFKEVLRVGRLAGALEPTRTFLIDTPPVTAYRRASGRDRMERRGQKYQEQVRRAFLHLARSYPRRVELIDGRGSAGEVHGRVLQRLPRRGWPIK